MSVLTPLPLPQKDRHMSHITLACPLPGEAPGAATSSEGLAAPCVCAHVMLDPGTQRQTHSFREEGALTVAHFLQRKASGWMTLTKARLRGD